MLRHRIGSTGNFDFEYSQLHSWVYSFSLLIQCKAASLLNYTLIVAMLLVNTFVSPCKYFTFTVTV